jgi:hypothetical protein
MTLHWNASLSGGSISYVEQQPPAHCYAGPPDLVEGQWPKRWEAAADNWWGHAHPWSDGWTRLMTSFRLE